MKQYRNLILFGVLFLLYIVAELNKREPVDWNVTLGKEDKNPYGSYILFNRLKDLFAEASVNSYQTPVYNQLNNFVGNNSVYFLIAPSFEPGRDDMKELKAYLKQGNFFFAAAQNISKSFQDTLGFKITSTVSFSGTDSTAINFVNPILKQQNDYVFRKMTLDAYFSKIDTANTIVLGVNNNSKPNFIRIDYGRGACFVHANPLCFSNYFMLFQKNNEYVSRALSYLPGDTHKIFWDEYGKSGPAGPQTPLRFFLSNVYLRWVLRLSMLGLLVYVLFESKRRQRIIPVIEPLQNTTLDFVKTVSSVYYNQKDNKGIASKKITYWLDYVRQRFYIPTQQLDNNFISQLARKSGVPEADVTALAEVMQQVEHADTVDNNLLLTLDRQIDKFYKQAK